MAAARRLASGKLQLALGRLARLHAMAEWLWPLALGQAVPSVLAMGRLARAVVAVSHAPRLLALGRLSSIYRGLHLRRRSNGGGSTP